MPTYEYICTKCKRHIEIFHKISDPPRKRCPSCRGALRRQIGTGAGILFKGSGFYTTDYRSEGYRKAASAEKKESAPKPAESSGAAAKAPSADSGAKKKS